MTTPLRVLLHGPLDGPLNMAIDETLLDGESRAFPFTLRLYAWRWPTVSLGYAQPYRQGFDEAAARRRGVRLVRRITGGRAVLHENELTYAIAGPADRGPFANGIQDTYRVVAEGLVEGLRRLGVEAALERARGRGEGGGGACFASRSRYELLGAGRKLLGSAQRRTPRRVLQHGSLPLSRPDPERWAVLGPSGSEAAAGSVGLEELLRAPCSFRHVAASLAAGIGARLSMSLHFDVMSRREWRQARSREQRYRDPDHTRQR